MQAITVSDINIRWTRPALAMADRTFACDLPKDVNTLISHLRHSVLLGEGRLGPQCYGAPPKELKEKNAYYWERTSPRVENPPIKPITVLGIEQNPIGTFVYFSPSTDTKTYVVTLARFQEGITFLNTPDMCVGEMPMGWPNVTVIQPIANTPETLSDIEHRFVDQLKGLPKRDDPNYNKDHYRAIGQQIFDAQPDTAHGRQSLQKIHAFIHSTDEERASTMEHDWNGVGNSTWDWMP